MQGRRIKRIELDLFIQTDALMHLFASRQILIAVYIENDDKSKSMFLIHCEQNLCSLEQILVHDPKSSCGAVWSRYLYFNQRSAKNNNQNISEPFISLGINGALNTCIGSVSAKMFEMDGKIIPEFIFARKKNSFLAQLSSAGIVSDQMDDKDLEFLPAYRAPELAKALGQEHRDGVSWTLLGGTEFDDLLEATKTNKNASHVRSVFLRGHPDIVEKQRVGMSSDGEVLSGCHWTGCGSLRSSARCREAVNNEGESRLVLEELNFEYENSLAAGVTSNSHMYLDIAGGHGEELLKLWRAHPSTCNANSPLAYKYPANLIKRMLDIKSPTNLKDAEKATWSIIHACHQAGLESGNMHVILAKCIAFLAVCQMNRRNLHDSTASRKDVLILISIARLEESLAVSEGDHCSTITTVLYSSRVFIIAEACHVCNSKSRSDYTSRNSFNDHVRECGNPRVRKRRKKKK